MYNLFIAFSSPIIRVSFVSVIPFCPAVIKNGSVKLILSIGSSVIPAGRSVIPSK